MSTKPMIAGIGAEAIRFLPAQVAQGPAGKLLHAPHDEGGRQMAVGIARVALPGEPLVCVTLVLGDAQFSLTLTPPDLDRFAHVLADAALWQNEELRRKAGHTVQ